MLISLSSLILPAHSGDSTIILKETTIGIDITVVQIEQNEKIKGQTQTITKPILNKSVLTQTFSEMRLHQTDIKTILCHQRIMAPFLYNSSPI